MSDGDQSPGVRAAGKARTRANLLDAAATVFAERGYGAASVDEIARAAGVSVGSVYAHFQSKQGLFIALMDRRRDADLSLAREHLAAGPEAAIGELNRQFIATADDRRVALLATEAWLYAMRDPEFGVAFAEHEAKIRRDLVPLIAAERERRGADWSMTDEEVASVTLSLFSGLVRQRRLAPEVVTDDLYGRALLTLLDGLERRD